MNYESFGSQPSSEGIKLDKAKRLEEELLTLMEEREDEDLPADREEERVEMVKYLRDLQKNFPRHEKEIGAMIARLSNLPALLLKRKKSPSSLDKAA